VTIRAYLLLEREAEARAEAAELLRMAPGFSLRQWTPTQPFQDPAAQEEVCDLLRHAGMPD
jgi:hypothetical protein